VTAGLGIAVTTFVSTLGSGVDALNTNIGLTLKLVLMLVTLAVNSFVFVLLFRLATTHRHSLRRAIPGAVMTAVLWQLLQLGGTVYVTEVIAHSSIANQIFATILGLFAYLFLGAMSVVLGVELNVVKAHRLYPRALLTPFTDNVNLTDADRRAYADYATAQSVKNFERVDVRFEHDGQYLRAKKMAQENGEKDFSDPEPAPVQHKTSGQPHDHH
jgi:membrane protein